ncbi:MAG: hypothetical protein IKB93_06330 [Clostridia bacterium]|nr:hypothetical protein [Clostridia bacterium]
MKKTFKVLVCLSASLLMATGVFAEKTQLYSLDGRTLYVDESQIAVYTAEGMGWFLEKPVTMYSADGRSIVVRADQVEAHKNVGWFLEGEQTSSDTTQKDENVNTEEPKSDTQENSSENNLVAIKYTDGTIIKAPAYQLDMYKALGWVEAGSAVAENETVTMYDANGVAKEVKLSEVSKYELAGWTKVKPDGEYITVYYYDGSTKSIPAASAESYKAQGWYSAYDEAVYAYAAFGNGADVVGATKLLEEKKYELAFNMVQDALDKIENTQSEYVSMLYYLRSMVTDTWREAAKSPLGFINYWFSEKDGKSLIVFEYRNVSNSRISSFKINFDICDKDGNIVETNSGSYFVNNLQMTPCEKKRVAWIITKGDVAASIKNLKVNEVVFSDNTKWNG